MLLHILGKSERLGEAADAGVLQCLDGPQEGPHQGEGPGQVQANAATSVPAREGRALLQEAGGEWGRVRESPVLQLQAVLKCE